MKKVLIATVVKLFGLLKGSVCGLLISLAPAAFIHHADLKIYLYQLDWTVTVFFCLSIIGCSFAFYFAPRWPNKLGLYALIYAFLYVSSAFLCQKTSISLFSGLYDSDSVAVSPLLFIPGFILIGLAVIHFVSAAFRQARITDNLTGKECRRSLYLSSLLFMGGIPMLLGVWLPLLAIPGAWVISSWLD